MYVRWCDWKRTCAGPSICTVQVCWESETKTGLEEGHHCLDVSFWSCGYRIDWRNFVFSFFSSLSIPWFICRVGVSYCYCEGIDSHGVKWSGTIDKYTRKKECSSASIQKSGSFCSVARRNRKMIDTGTCGSLLGHPLRPMLDVIHKSGGGRYVTCWCVYWYIENRSIKTTSTLQIRIGPVFRRFCVTIRG